MARQNEVKGPRFVRYFGPVLEVLKGLGGSGSPEEVRATVASRLSISEEEQSEQLPSGSSRFDNQVAWARFYLTRAGLLDASRRGVWSLTEKGRSTSLSNAAALQLFKDIHKLFSAERRARRAAATEDEPLEESTPEAAAASSGPAGRREELLGIIKALPAPGFERLCQRLLRESGFQHVTITENDRQHPAASAVLIGASLEEFLRTWVEAAGLPSAVRSPASTPTARP